MANSLAVSETCAVPVKDFDEWMRGEQRRVFQLCYHMLGDPEDADAAAQDSFLKAYQALDRLESSDLKDPRRWVIRIAVNTCLDRLRSRRWQFWRRRPNAESEAAILASTASHGPSAEDQVFARQISKRLTEGLQKLSDRQRSIFLLRHTENLSLDEIATVLEVEVGTVKAHMARAVAKLRVELKDLYGGTARHSGVIAGAGGSR